MTDYPEFPKIARLKRGCFVSEKIDGTNALISISEDGVMRTGSRTRWITPDDDNFGFASWAEQNKADLLTLGHGNHYGEWWGLGIQRNYDQKWKRFSLFNAFRWTDTRPDCCGVVPVLYKGVFDTAAIDSVMRELSENGSVAAPGFMKPEGVIIYHEASRLYYKKTLDKDDEYKGAA